MHGLIVQQDNARPRNARAVTAELQRSDVEILPWPSRSPDLSPIEQLCDAIGRNVHNVEIGLLTDLRTLATRLIGEWNAVTQITVNNLIASVPNRLRHYVEKSGGHTRY